MTDQPQDLQPQAPQEPQQPQQQVPPPAGAPPHDPQMPGGQMPPAKPSVPFASGALVLGICSLAFLLCCYSWGLSLILGTIGLILGIKGVNAYKANPSAYSEKSYKNANAGRIMSIVGLCVAVAFILFIVIFFWGYVSVVLGGMGLMSSQADFGGY